MCTIWNRLVFFSLSWKTIYFGSSVKREEGVSIQFHLQIKCASSKVTKSFPCLRTCSRIHAGITNHIHRAGLGTSMPSLGRWLNARQPDPLFLSFTSKWPRCGLYFLTLPAEFPNYYFLDCAMQCYVSAHPRAPPYIEIDDVLTCPVYIYIYKSKLLTKGQYWPLLNLLIKLIKNHHYF